MTICVSAGAWFICDGFDPSKFPSAWLASGRSLTAADDKRCCLMPAENRLRAASLPRTA